MALAPPSLSLASQADDVKALLQDATAPNLFATSDPAQSTKAKVASKGLTAAGQSVPYLPPSLPLQLSPVSFILGASLLANEYQPGSRGDGTGGDGSDQPLISSTGIDPQLFHTRNSSLEGATKLKFV